MRIWNSENLQRQYVRVKTEAVQHDGFTADEVDSHYLDKLSHQTRSPRIMRMIRLAYTLGRLRGIASVDEGMTPLALRFTPKEETR